MLCKKVHLLVLLMGASKLTCERPQDCTAVVPITFDEHVTQSIGTSRVHLVLNNRLNASVACFSSPGVPMIVLLFSRTSLRSESLFGFLSFFFVRGAYGARGPSAKDVLASDAHQVHPPAPWNVAHQPLLFQFEFDPPASSWALCFRRLFPVSGVPFGLQDARCCPTTGSPMCSDAL